MIEKKGRATGATRKAQSMDDVLVDPDTGRVGELNADGRANARAFRDAMRSKLRECGRRTATPVAAVVQKRHSMFVSAPAEPAPRVARALKRLDRMIESMQSTRDILETMSTEGAWQIDAEALVTKLVDPWWVSHVGTIGPNKLANELAMRFVDAAEYAAGLANHAGDVDGVAVVRAALLARFVDADIVCFNDEQIRSAVASCRRRAKRGASGKWEILAGILDDAVLCSFTADVLKRKHRLWGARGRPKGRAKGAE